MKIEVIIRHMSGDVKKYLVHKLVRHGDIWTAHYTTVKSGRHVSRKINIDGAVATLEVIK